MDQDTQQAIAVWAVFILPFLIFGGFLYIRNQLTLEIVAMYWFPAVVLTRPDDYRSDSATLEIAR